jgi:hypothetical protein
METEIISAMRAKLEREVEELEEDIDDAEISVSEEWVRVAQDIAEIKKRFVTAKAKKESLFGCKSFDAYCKTDRSRFGKSYSNELIAALEVRKLLPEPTGRPVGLTWSAQTIRPLTKLKSDQAKRAAGKNALALIEKASNAGEKLSLTKAAEQAAEAAKNTVAEMRAQEKAAEEKLASTRPVANLKRLIEYAHKHLAALEMWPDDYWTDAEEEEPGIATRVAEALEQLASFLRD